jgi:histidinol-phosphate aminotransferase
MDDQSKKLNGRIGRVMRLGQNEWTVPFPEDALREMLGTITGEDFVAIPELERARVKVAGFFGVPREQLLFSNGSDAGIKAVFEAFVREGDEVVLFRPMFSRYAELCRLYGAKQRVIRYRDDLTFDFDELLDAVSRRPRLVALVNPNNPTGTVVSTSALVELVEAAAASGSLVLVDEAYHYFCDVTVVSEVERFANLVVTRSFSKAFGALAARIGAVVAQPSILGRLKPLMTRPEISGLSGRIVEYLVEHPELMHAHVAMTRASQAYVREALGTLDLEVLSTSAGSVLVRLPASVDRDLFVEDLLEDGIEVGGRFEAPLDRHVRVGLGPVTQMEELVEVFAGRLERTRASLTA